MKEIFWNDRFGSKSYFLGIEVIEKDDGIFISQNKYAKYVLKKFNVENSKLASMSNEEKMKYTRKNNDNKV